MQFQIDEDSGGVVGGWMVPDNPSATPVIAIRVPSHEEILLPANVFRQDLKNLGRHNTGLVGFHIDQNVVPDFKATDDIELRDASTDIVIYRRFNSDHHLEAKLFRYELSAMPQLIVDSACASHFTLTYKAVERYGFDTLFGIINNPKATSVYISGRPHLMRYIQLLRDRGFKTAVLLRDPIEELAERLIFLKFAGGNNRPDFVLNYLHGLEALIPFALSLDLGHEERLAASFRSLPETQILALSNPFVRTLACVADEIADNTHVSIALENLANIDLVGLHHRFGQFESDLYQLLKTDIVGDAEPASISTVADLAKKLSGIRAVQKMLALDLRLFRFVTEAVEQTYKVK